MLYKFDRFPGFGADDFGAFAERKWSSNRFNLERMKTRARLDALGREMADSVGRELEGLVFRTTLDHPHIFNRNQVREMWGYLDRPEEERTELMRVVDREMPLKDMVDDPVPQHQVALTGVGVDAEGATLFLRLHSNARLDRRNLAARLADPMEEAEWAALVKRLPGAYAFEVDGNRMKLSDAAKGASALRSWLESLTGWFRVERRLTPDEAGDGPRMLSIVTDELPGLLGLWRFGAWSRSNDRLKLARSLKEERKQKARKLSGFESGDAVIVTGGLLSGKTGTVVDVDLKGRVRVQLGRINIEMDPKLLRKA
ncbi:MAG: hypothetical protein FJ109_08570 [Deltaproteobacteria bacterium]|nr:hypothetical protein [Deltaproteobacteria bacterium]